MADILSPEARSEQMRRIRAQDTAPEMRVRRLVHRLGYRYRLHRRDLPGRPDLAFPSRKKVIFVHGCFWHRHPGCSRTRTPKSRVSYWEEKFRSNVARDVRKQAELRTLGWDFLIVWECETHNLEEVARRVVDFLDKPT